MRYLTLQTKGIKINNGISAGVNMFCALPTYRYVNRTLFGMLLSIQLGVELGMQICAQIGTQSGPRLGSTPAVIFAARVAV